MRRLLSALALLFTSGSAHAGFVTISQTNIGVGQSVTLDFSSIPSVSYPSADSLIPPGGSISIFSNDATAHTFQTVTAPGSEEASYSFSSCLTAPGGGCAAFPNAGISFSDHLTFTYVHAGNFSIDYLVGTDISVGYIYVTFDAEGNFFGTGHRILSNDVSETGQFAITVGSVPEPSTWAMLLIGFAGIGVLRNFSKVKNKELHQHDPGVA